MNLGDTLAGRFEIESLAGTGGMGTVYRAVDRHSGGWVAVKVFYPQSNHGAQRFAREAALLAQVSHPAVVRYVGHGSTAQGAQFLVMEWVEGETLTQHLVDHQQLDVASTLALGNRIAQALAAAHQLGVIHRDLKPSNIILPAGHPERAKLLDFGVARRTREMQALTRAEALVGTPGYMSPEQARAARDVDARADVFSLGCVLYECLTGEPAFMGETVMAVQAKILWQEVPHASDLVPEVPAAVSTLIARMLSKEREGRPTDCMQVHAELASLELADRPTLVGSAEDFAGAEEDTEAQDGPGDAADDGDAASDRGGPPVAGAVVAGRAAAVEVWAPTAVAEPTRSSPDRHLAAIPTPQTMLATPKRQEPRARLRTEAALTPDAPLLPGGSGAPLGGRRAGSAIPGRPSTLGRRRSTGGRLLTVSEMRMVCVICAGTGRLHPLGTSAGSGVIGAGARVSTSGGELEGSSARPGRLHELRKLVEPYSAHLEILAAGGVVVTLSGSGTATDLAVRAARCALALRPQLEGAPVVIATGRAVVSSMLPVGEVIDRASRLLAALAPADKAAGPEPAGVASDAEAAPAIRIDETTAGLLARTFQVEGDALGLYLGEERELDGGAEVDYRLLGRTTPFVGRERELGSLEAIVEEAVGEPVARAVLLIGPAGSGKSRVLEELLRRARRSHPDLEVLLGRADALSAGSPFGLLGQALRRSARIGEGEAPEVRQKKLRARLGRHLPAAALDRASAFVGELCGIPFPDEDNEALRAARQDPQLMSDATRSACEDWLRAESSAQPLLILLEDLHWGDLPSVKLLDGALSRLKDRPLLVLATGRPEVHQQFPGLWEQRDLQEIRLLALTRSASEKLVKSVLDDSVSAATVARIVAQAAGNAFYLEELIRAVAARQSRPAASARPETTARVALPDSVLGMVQARLDALGQEAKRVLRAASLFGQVFWQRGLDRLLGEDPGGLGVSEWLEELTAREIIVATETPQFPGEVAFAFRHDLVREGAYAMLTESDRRLGHRLVGEWLLSAGASDALLLAEHFRRSDEPARAATWFRRAAEQCLDSSDLAGALDRSRQGLACGAVGADRGALHLIQAEACRWLGRHGAGYRRAAVATRHLPAAEALWFRAVGQAILAAGQLGHVERALYWVREARLAEPAAQESWAPQALDDARAAQVICLCRGAIRLLHAGRHADAEELLGDIGQRAAALPRLPLLAAVRLHQTRVVAALHAGDLGSMLDDQRRVVAAFEQVGDAPNACLERCHLGLVYGELGAFALAEETLRAALIEAERLTLRKTRAWAAVYLSAVLVQRGLLDEAEQHARHAQSAAEGQRDPRLSGLARVQLATSAERRGKLEAAREHARAAAELLAQAPPLLAVALATLGRIELELHHWEPAMESARRAQGLLESLGGIEGSEALVRLVHVQVLQAAGETEEATQALRRARDRLLQRAQPIQDPELRHTFLHDHPDHALTLSLFALRFPTLA